jgi:uncharacterized protein (TIGR02596 family)
VKTELRQLASRGRAAFTLIELLVVIGIILILIALLVSPAGHILDGLSVTSAGQAIQSQLALDRQLAISQNRSIEIRFYEVPELVAMNQNRFTMHQSWIYDANGVNPVALGKISSLPGGTLIDAMPTSGGSATKCSSTLIDLAPHGGTQKIPSAGSGDYPYRSFRFTGNGSTDLALNGPGSDTWFLTVRRATDAATAETPSKNYYVIQLDPLTGETKVFRP